MSLSLNLLAKLDYPSAPVMLVSTAVMVAFIGVGGWMFKQAEIKAKAEREARLARLAAKQKATNP